MTKQRVLPVFAALVFLAVVLPVVENVADNTSTHATSHVKIRGSVCALNVSTANPIFAISIMLGYVIPLTVTLVMSCATHASHVKELCRRNGHRPQRSQISPRYERCYHFTVLCQQDSIIWFDCLGVQCQQCKGFCISDCDAPGISGPSLYSAPVHHHPQNHPPHSCWTVCEIIYQPGRG